MYTPLFVEYSAFSENISWSSWRPGNFYKHRFALFPDRITHGNMESKSRYWTLSSIILNL